MQYNFNVTPFNSSFILKIKQSQKIKQFQHETTAKTLKKHLNKNNFNPKIIHHSEKYSSS